MMNATHAVLKPSIELHAGGLSAPALAGGALAQAKLAYTTRRADLGEAATLLRDGVAPRSGDLVLARVDELGQHDRLELRDGRRAMLFPGDEVVVCYGHRYAPDQFEAEVPRHIAPCHLAAAGGIAGCMLTRHAAIKDATRITPVGILGDASGRPLNLSRWALQPLAPPRPRPPTVVVVGTSMNAGKSTMAANLVKGLSAAAYPVGAAKITGTGAGGDLWMLRDAGAGPVLDFTDAGHASTYKASEAEVERIFVTLTMHLAAAGAGAIVLEIADGVFQPETAALLRSPTFAAGVDHILFAGGDAAGTVAGVADLRAHGHEIAAIGGQVSSSPLGAREAELATGLPVLDSGALRLPDALPGLLSPASVVAA